MNALPSVSFFDDLVNKLLDDSDRMSQEGLTQPGNFSQNWCMDNDSIGQLAIKLADITLMDDNFMTNPPPLNSRSASVGFKMPELKHHGTGFKGHDVEPLGDGGSLKDKYTPKGVSRISSRSSIKLNIDSVKEPELNVKSGGSNIFLKKRKYTPKWNESRNKPNLAVNKAFRKYDASAGFLATKTDPYLTNHLTSSESPQGYSGAPFWKKCPAFGSKSDGSSSSNSSVYKETTTFSASNAPKFKTHFKRNNSDEKNFKPCQRSYKAYSTSSSSSSSGGQMKYSECVFCKTNGETASTYRSHVLKDDRGRTVCQVLQQYVCPLCGATGVNAHTVKYCPKNDNPPQVATMTTLKSMRSSTGRKRHGYCSGQIRHVPLGFRGSLLSA